jgi:hypothetical protein
MLKYNIEGNIDFFAELYKSLDEEVNEHKTEEDDNLCLISNSQLTDKFVQLDCGHKFNYIPLFLDVKNHKQLFNLMESTSSRLNIDEIRCPYCRKKQKGLLPYYEELCLKEHGVNYIDPNINYYVSSNCKKKCEYLTLNPDYVKGVNIKGVNVKGVTDASGNNVDASGNNVDASGNNVDDDDDGYNVNSKYIKCYMMGSQIHYTDGYLNGESKCYCWSHKKIVIKKEIKEKKEKEKVELQKQKLKNKEEALAKKEEEKQKIKEEKQKIKEEKKKVSKNIVLGPSIISVEPLQNDETKENKEISGCIVILKSGPNKGTTCGCKVVSENMCKRHCNKN